MITLFRLPKGTFIDNEKTLIDLVNDKLIYGVASFTVDKSGMVVRTPPAQAKQPEAY